MKKVKLLSIAVIAVLLTMTSCQKQPEASFQTDKASYHAGEKVYLTNTSSDGDSYKWTMPNGDIEDSKNASYTIPQTQAVGQVSFQLEAFSKNHNKSDKASKSVNVTAPIVCIPYCGPNTCSIAGYVPVSSTACCPADHPYHCGTYCYETAEDAVNAGCANPETCCNCSGVTSSSQCFIGQWTATDCGQTMTLVFYSTGIVTQNDHSCDGTITRVRQANWTEVSSGVLSFVYTVYTHNGVNQGLPPSDTKTYSCSGSTMNFGGVTWNK